MNTKMAKARRKKEKNDGLKGAGKQTQNDPKVIRNRHKMTTNS